MSGYVEMFGSHMIETSCARQATVALSSGEAEYYALTRGVVAGRMSQQIWEIIGCKLPLVARTDSSAGKGIAQRWGVGKQAPRAQRALVAGLRPTGQGADPEGTHAKGLHGSDLGNVPERELRCCRFLDVHAHCASSGLDRASSTGKENCWALWKEQGGRKEKLVDTDGRFRAGRGQPRTCVTLWAQRAHTKEACGRDRGRQQ